MIVYGICSTIVAQACFSVVHSINSVADEFRSHRIAITALQLEAIQLRDKVIKDSIALVEIHSRESQTKEIISNNKAEIDIHLSSVFTSIADLKAINHLK